MYNNSCANKQDQPNPNFKPDPNPIPNAHPIPNPNPKHSRQKNVKNSQETSLRVCWGTSYCLNLGILL